MSNEQEWTNDAKILETYEYFDEDKYITNKLKEYETLKGATAMLLNAIFWIYAVGMVVAIYFYLNWASEHHSYTETYTAYIRIAELAASVILTKIGLKVVEYLIKAKFDHVIELTLIRRNMLRA